MVFFKIYFMKVSVLSVCMYLYMCLVPVELELWLVVSHHVGQGTEPRPSARMTVLHQ